MKLEIKLAKAVAIANRIVEILGPHCDKIDIAGSVRRKKEIVGDLEICCIPKKEFIKQDLFGGGSNIAITGFTQGLNTICDRLIQGNINGRMLQMILRNTSGVSLDLFMPEPHDYYRQLVIRTGSADYVRKIIANAWRSHGWCGTINAGLRKTMDCIEDDSKNHLWKCLKLTGEVPPAWQSEQEFFAWLNLDWIEPGNRDFKHEYY
jgi:DNA polymerase/3'-5' exonuclease PolX